MRPATTDRTPPICTNCLYHGDCVFERTAPGPIWECDEHAVRRPAPRQASAKDQGTPSTTSTATGLCATCDHRSYCTLRDPERIVLHCEHFE